MSNNIKIFIHKSRIIGFFLNLNSGFDEFYSLSFTNKIIVNITKWFKMFLRSCILGRLPKMSNNEKKDFFFESIVVKKVYGTLNFLLDKLSNSYEENKVINKIKRFKSQFENINSKQLGYIVIIAIITNLFLNVIFKQEINYFFLVLKSGFFLSGIFLILSNLDLNTILKNSYFYRRLSK